MRHTSIILWIFMMAFYMMNSVMAFKNICFLSYNSLLIFLLNAWSFLFKEVSTRTTFTVVEVESF